MTIGERIKNLRNEKDLSQGDLAKLAGYSDKTAISKFEHAGDDISMKQVRRVANALNVPASYLMGWGEVEISANAEQRKRAEELYELYSKANPEVQKAVETILKSSQ